MCAEHGKEMRAGMLEQVSGVMCDKRISTRMKGQVYKMLVRPAMLYGFNTKRTGGRAGGSRD